MDKGDLLNGNYPHLLCITLQWALHLEK